MTTPTRFASPDGAVYTAELLTVSQVCRRIPGARNNCRVSPSTVTRWILTGCPGRSGGRIKLAATRAGARWLIAPDDLQAFFAALAAPDVAVPAPTPKGRTAVQRQRDSDRAVLELERRGA